MSAVVETLTPDERLRAAIRLEPTDRVPVLPTLLPEPAAGLTGRSQAEIARDGAAAVQAVFEIFDMHGGWENPYPASYTPVQLQASGVFPMRMRIPGVDLADDIPYQLDEVEILTPADFDTIAEVGFARFFEDDFLWRITDLERDELPRALDAMVRNGGLFLGECAKRGTRPFFLASALHPFFTLSLMRSMVPFTQDLYYAPEPAERALARMTADLIDEKLAFAKQIGSDVWLLTEERASGFFFPPAFFERYWWPYTRDIVEAFWSEGIVTLFHFDTCWDKNLAYFKDLPKGSAILELDGTTDIFAAKEILGGHLCLKGDVPAALLSVGTPQAVEAYCCKLIDVVGRGGGFILSSGCSVPPDARPANFRAMIETGKSRNPSG
jgi:uroporphyrinogen-III decarboxylase